MRTDFISTKFRIPVALDLPRWRGRGWLNEVDAKHLRFTLPETEACIIGLVLPIRQ
jgi:ATP/maltotriose-dependent transcriptional regulator MalT